MCLLIVSGTVLIAPKAYAESTCFGTPGSGRIENSVKLPASGANFVAYGMVPRILGRTYVHTTVEKVMRDAYATLAQRRPETVFMYAETGSRHGGPFKPHKTHQNGLSVDHIVPVLNRSNTSVHLPTRAWNRYGYDIDFDSNGNYKDYRIDFEAMASHIIALVDSARKHGIKIRRVLFAPDLQGKLYATRSGKDLKRLVKIPTKRSWVRHDDHYHIDFDIPCKPL